jgi:peptidoglycan hydrolase-like protein with peptidoglycan-binding domain
MKVRFLTLLLVAVAAFSVVGCAGNKKLEKEVEALRMQVNTLSSDVSQLDAQQKELDASLKAQPADTGAASFDESASVGAAPMKGSFGSNIYRTPSGFTLQTTTLQRALKNAGYYTGPVDGKAGAGTKDAIRRFQSDNGLTADGVCGRATWAKLKSYSH